MIEGNRTPILNISPIKQFVSRRLHPQTPLRYVISIENDELTPYEFLSKLQVWLALLQRGEDK